MYSGKETQHLGDHQHSIRLLCGIDHGVTILDGQSHGLLHEHVLARGERLQGQGRMQVGRHAEVDRFNVRVGDEVLHPSIASGRAQVNGSPSPLQVAPDVT